MFELQKLPYSDDALEPYISKKTIQFHYGKHNKAYVDKLNALIPETEHKNQSLEEIVLSSKGGIFNNAAQIWNHAFYWRCMSEKHHQKPSDNLSTVLAKHFGSTEEFITQFSDAAATVFGSGWAWLVFNPTDSSLKIIQTHDADNPLTHNLIPLLGCDVWEHAYYLDTQNQRPQYLKNFFNVVDWGFVEKQLEVAREQ